MMLLKLTLAVVILVATIIGMARVKRHLDGDSGGSLFGSARKREERASRTDLEEFVQAYRREHGGAGGAARQALAAPAAASPATATPAAGAPHPSPTAPRARAAYLDGAKKVMYLVLKSGLPDHHVFANCNLAELFEAGAALPPAFSQARADLVVCRSDLRAVAVVDVGAPADALNRALEAQLTSAGIRYVRVQPPALPKPAQVRALIYPG
jgi:hypothetical protein